MKAVVQASLPALLARTGRQDACSTRRAGHGGCLVGIDFSSRSLFSLFMATSRARFRYSSIEALESRIAPALLVNGANLLGGSSPSVGETSAGGNSVPLVHVISGQAIVWYQDGHILGISVGPNANLEIQGDVQGDIIANLTAAGRLSDSDNN